MANLSSLLFSAMCVVFVCGHPFVTINSSGEGITMEGGSVRCGDLSCPAQSTGCIYQKRTNEHNPRLVDVMRRCVDRNGVTIAESFNQFEGVPGQYYNSVVNSGFQSSSNIVVVNEMTREKQAELQRHIDQVNRNVQNTVDQAMRNLNRQLKNLEDVFRISF